MTTEHRADKTDHENHQLGNDLKHRRGDTDSVLYLEIHTELKLFKINKIYMYVKPMYLLQELYVAGIWMKYVLIWYVIQITHKNTINASNVE